ncbi:MAG: TonB-dependent receptor [Terracidiphilus sp.]
MRSILCRCRLLAVALIYVICCQNHLSLALAQQAVIPDEQILSLNSGPALPSDDLDGGPSITAAPLVPALPPIPANPVAAGVRVIPPTQSTVEVNADEQTLKNGLAVPYHITQSEVLSSAGTWGDFSRFLQVLPGVVWNADMSNDVMVRGGNPSENLYVVDGIEVPNMNHLAVEGTTGGFTSMIDTSTIDSVEMKAGAYDARYSSRLSSLIEVHTGPGLEKENEGQLDLGISGAGGFLQRSLGGKANLLLSGHRSVLNLVTNDIGINGVPIYTDGMARLEWSPGSKDRISALSLNGADSIDITPDVCDPGVTLNDRTQYGGARSTDGVIWQHIHGPVTVSTVTASYSAQSQNIGQQLQSTTLLNKDGCWNGPIQTATVYQERTQDGISTLSYGLQLGKRGWLYSMGATGRLAGMNYAVAQPQGQQSPFNASSAWTDADSFTRQLITGQTAFYAEATGRLGTRWTVIAGAREETFALTAAHMFEPRASVGFVISKHQTLNGTYSRSSQLAPAINILSYAGNALLRPMQVEQYSLGADLWRAGWASASVEAYHKHYSNEPVSTEYPGLMLANMVDTLGQQFVWLPLKTGGYGQSEGIELLLRARAAGRFRLLGSASYSRTRYAAADGVLRSGNFDFPLVTNGLTTARLFGGVILALRDTYATGRPYTPFNVPLSEQQSRGIYDLTQINALRGSAYNRVDADLNRDIRIRKGSLNIHVGMENALNRKNFLGYLWMDSCHPLPGATICGLNPNAFPGVPETRVTQMPRFPSAAIRYSF